VADQLAIRSGSAIQQQRQVAGLRILLARRDQQSEAVTLDEVVQLGEIGLFEVLW
jgi:hypothetical protein